MSSTALSPAEIIGPIADAGGPNRLDLQRGEVVEELGDTERVDMCRNPLALEWLPLATLAHPREAQPRVRLSVVARRRPSAPVEVAATASK